MAKRGPKPDDLTGRRFGKLKVIRQAENVNNRTRWLCKCDCGKEKIILRISLISNSTKSCGCYNKEQIHKKLFKDLTGKIFGKLTVVEYKGKNKFNDSLWLCTCECGNSKIISGMSLKTSGTKSCGCIKNIDLTGQRFGKLVVMSRAKTPKHIKGNRNYWLCKCDCGNEKVISLTNLRAKNHSRSCGCLRHKTAANFQDLTGQRFGRLVVLERSESKMTKAGLRTYWLCRCDCGNEKIAPASTLKKGTCTSCGCYKPNALPRDESARNRVIETYKNGAIRKKIPFELTREEFFKLTDDNCAYCGQEPYLVSKSHSESDDYIHNGVDRVDNSKGYTKKNCVPCCTPCNFAKRTMGVDKFYEWVDRVQAHPARVTS
jgi:CDGSH-type Zn-finger protein